MKKNDGENGEREVHTGPDAYLDKQVPRLVFGNVPVLMFFFVFLWFQDVREDPLKSPSWELFLEEGLPETLWVPLGALLIWLLWPFSRPLGRWRCAAAGAIWWLGFALFLWTFGNGTPLVDLPWLLAITLLFGTLFGELARYSALKTRRWQEANFPWLVEGETPRP